MNRWIVNRIVIVAVLGCGGPDPAMGVEIFKWVSPDGVTHFSEARPARVSGNVESLQIVAPEPASSAPQDYRSLLEVADSIEASRLERERLRLEQREHADATAGPMTPATPVQASEPYFVLPYRRPFPPYLRPPRPEPRPPAMPPGNFARWNPGQRFAD